MDLRPTKDFRVVDVRAGVIRLPGALLGVLCGGVDVANGIDGNFGPFNQTAQVGITSHADTNHSETQRTVLTLHGTCDCCDRCPLQEAPPDNSVGGHFTLPCLKIAHCGKSPARLSFCWTRSISVATPLAT